MSSSSSSASGNSAAVGAGDASVPSPHWTSIEAYHHLSKHDFNKFAPSKGRLDWANQPVPFRHYHPHTSFDKIQRPNATANLQYSDSQHVFYMHFPDEQKDSQVKLSELFADLPPSLKGAAAPVNSRTISQFFYYSMALSAWKQAGHSKWSLRVDPSSGNLHPTESYLWIPHDLLTQESSAAASSSSSSATSSALAAATDASIFHYDPLHHSLERRVSLPAKRLQTLLSPVSTDACFAVSLSSVYWRETWKYGLRGFRYCQHDTGHALACLRFSAAMLGWQLRTIDHRLEEDHQWNDILGFSRPNEFHEDEREFHECIFLVGPPTVHTHSKPDDSALSDVNSWKKELKYFGSPNVLSNSHHIWKEVHEIHQHTPRTASAMKQFMQHFQVPIKDCADSDLHSPSSSSSSDSAATSAVTVVDDLSRHLSPFVKIRAGPIIRARRSAVDMNGTTYIDLQQFFAILCTLMHSDSRGRILPPFDALAFSATSPAFVHLILYVHRVKGLAPGVYVLMRDYRQTSLDGLKAFFRPGFQWTAVPNCPVPLYLLLSGDAGAAAQRFSCDQEIASDGIFAVSMLSKFKHTIQQDAHAYRRLFWESGAIGQCLYLSAEGVCGGDGTIRGTGIGCYYDQPVHKMLFADEKATDYQVLYHFTIGGAVIDTRLRTLHAYAWGKE